MDWQGLLKNQWQLSTYRLQRSVEDVTPDEATARPQDLAPIAWQVGHVSYYDAMLLKRAGLPVDIPPEHEELFPIGTDGRGQLPPLAELVQVFRARSERIASLLEDPAALARPTHGTANYSTLAEGVMYVIGHRGYHLGKIMTLRALLGKPRLT
ncbi:MAG: hypothetical protein BAA04_01895 [Firmicutes bacterium ZCTH02-B6]|nr:MAG: hypothetical protein BAA04_01895 [Firmicutes bacterium ZCTH02-B6]